MDTDLIYSSTIDTISVEFLKKDNLSEKGEDIINGGDRTLPTWSTLLVDLKWVIDKKNNLHQNFRRQIIKDIKIIA